MAQVNTAPSQGVEEKVLDGIKNALVDRFLLSVKQVGSKKLIYSVDLKRLYGVEILDEKPNIGDKNFYTINLESGKLAEGDAQYVIASIGKFDILVYTMDLIDLRELDDYSS